ncbi:MAG: CRISPR-associated protein Cas4, partial [Dehalococcoidia bacterium]|nr:CRISPR-associated protein Cas4 [Dehalococcoidia bacterium]
IRGRIAHERVDSGEDRSTRGTRSLRALPLWSDEHGLIGKADVVEIHDDVPFPVEYKVGRRSAHPVTGEAHADLQLCAQALCLEEMFGVTVPAGAVYSRAERRRYPVRFDASLRNRTLDAIEGVREQLARQIVPDAPNDKRCPNCSLVNACLPSVVGARRRRTDSHQLFVPQPLGD